MTFLGSVTTGTTRWGRALYCCSSTTLGSIMTKRSWSGVKRKRREAMMVLMQTDFPEPVLPAIRTWGISARSAMMGWP